LDYVLSLDIPEAMEQIYTAIKRDNEEKTMFRWIAGGYERIMSFSDFKERLNANADIKQVFDTRTEADILADVKSILDGCTPETKSKEA